MNRNKLSDLFLDVFRERMDVENGSGIIAAVRYLLEADNLKVFYDAAEMARDNGVGMPDFVEGVIRFQALQLALIILPDTAEEAKELQESITMLFDVELRKTLNMMVQLQERKKEKGAK